MNFFTAVYSQLFRFASILFLQVETRMLQILLCVCLVLLQPNGYIFSSALKGKFRFIVLSAGTEIWPTCGRMPNLKRQNATETLNFFL